MFEVASNSIRLVYCAGPGLGELQTAGRPARFTITAHDADGVRATSGDRYNLHVQYNSYYRISSISST